MVEPCAIIGGRMLSVNPAVAPWNGSIVPEQNLPRWLVDPAAALQLAVRNETLREDRREARPLARPTPFQHVHPHARVPRAGEPQRPRGSEREVDDDALAPEPAGGPSIDDTDLDRAAICEVGDADDRPERPARVGCDQRVLVHPLAARGLSAMPLGPVEGCLAHVAFQDMLVPGGVMTSGGSPAGRPGRARRQGEEQRKPEGARMSKMRSHL